MKNVRFSKNKLTTAVIVALSLQMMACSSDDNDKNEAIVETPVQITKPLLPEGLGYEQYVTIPNVSDPLPATAYIFRNGGDGRFFRDTNPVNYALRGINKIWRGTTEQWQTTAGDYTDEQNGYQAGDGPNPFNAANGKPSDYVEPGTEIIDSEAWKANIQYVIDVTKNRTEDQALLAFLDDIRSKSYSTIDGYGPLTEDFVANSGAKAVFQPILVDDVLINNRYAQANNDSFIDYGGQPDTPLGDIVELARWFRSAPASTSGPKYVYATPRPWRMMDTGEIDFQKVESLTCVDGASDTREEKEYRIDLYTTSVSVIPGLYCGRRAHSASKEAEGLYTATTENRRKDNGYPSGHTNAGILGALAYAYALPERFAEQVFRGSQLGENRILAGMHSPVDVIGGRMQALIVATSALYYKPEVAEAAYQLSGEFFGSKAAQMSMSLYDYAHRSIEQESLRNTDGTLNVNVVNNNRYNDHEALKATYLDRMTYGLPQTGTKGLPAIVPENAEILLQSRQPYLTDAQRRAVLASTEIDSGYPLLDDSNGWGRINLFAASDGYGAFDGDVNVYMNASDGRFSARDWWRNDISGAGKLTKDGSGKLILTGNNTYSGGTVINGGILEAQSSSAFGSNDVYITSGEMRVNSNGSVTIGGNLTQNSGAMTINLDSDESQINVDGVTYLEQGQLVLQSNNMEIKAGDTFTLITAKGGLKGQFSDVTLNGYSVALTYTDTSVTATIIN